MSKSKIFFWLLAAFIIGVGAASFLPLNLHVVAAIFISGGSIAAFGALGTGRQRFIIVGSCTIILASGAFWFLWRDLPEPSRFDRAIGHVIVFEGIVSDEPIRRSGSQHVLVQDAAGGGAVFLILRPFPLYRYGERLSVSGRLERQDKERGPRFRMIYPDIDKLGSSGFSVYRALLAAKERFSGVLVRHLPEPHGSFAAGLLLGERQNFPASLRRDLQITGTAHIVALSGYNITIVADTLLRLFALLCLPLGVAWWLAIAGIAAFALVTGAAPSVVRAAIMGALVLIARRTGRIYRMQNALALAAAIMLVHNPAILRFDVGFQLSFLATLGLLYLAPPIDAMLAGIRGRILPAGRTGILRPSFLRGITSSTLAAQAAVLPLLVFYFGELSVIAPLANLAILPLIPLTMLAGAITGGLGLISDTLGQASALLSRAPISYELLAIRLFADIPAASVGVGGIGLGAFAGAYLLAAFLIWHRR